LIGKEAEKILRIFEENSVDYQLYEHEPVYTSKQAANSRGVKLKTGCKSMVLISNGNSRSFGTRMNDFSSFSEKNVEFFDFPEKS